MNQPCKPHTRLLKRSTINGNTSIAIPLTRPSSFVQDATHFGFKVLAFSGHLLLATPLGRRRGSVSIVGRIANPVQTSQPAEHGNFLEFALVALASLLITLLALKTASSRP